MDFEEGNSGNLPLTSLTPLTAAAHELKTPLVLLRQLSLQFGETDDPRARAETARRMRLTSERGLRLVDNLTKAARLDDALFQLEPVQLGGVCREVLDEISPLAQALNQEISLKIARQLPPVVANRDLLRGLLVNLLDNSLQYNPPAKTVEISARICRARAQISVRDHGAILDLGEFRRLRANLGNQNQPLSARPLSSGLGLFIAGQFARAMHGRLAVERHREGGLTFSASLPISRQLSLFEGA